MSDRTVPILDLSQQIEGLWDEINEAIQRVLRSGRFILGPEVSAFEQEVAHYLGVNHAFGLNSGTDALTIGLRSLGIGPGDEVITTPFSFFATAESISNVGAKPVFVDIEEESMNIDPRLIEAAITDRTKAIMPVHLFGRPAAMAHIMQIAKRYSLNVIEDCAQSFGASYAASCSACQCQQTSRHQLAGKKTGSIGDLGAFSFYPSKNLGAFGDGGLLVTDSDALAEKITMLRNHGAKQQYHNTMLGYNSRLDSLQAAILRVKLPYVDHWNSCRRRIAQRYELLLQTHAGIITPQIVDGHVFHQYTLRLTQTNRDALRLDLEKQGINTMIYYPIPQDRLPVYKESYGRFVHSDRLAEQVLSLPMWPELSDQQQAHVSATLLHKLEEVVV